MTVNRTAPVSVSITANPGSSVCPGSTSVTYRFNPVDGGSSPAYQWFNRANPIAETSSTYALNGNINGDEISVQLTSGKPVQQVTRPHRMPSILR
ncbi:MAG: hypothetical protein U0T56_01535 [Ferruginibacter sp.]